VTNGGRLFRAYLDGFSSNLSHREFTTASKGVDFNKPSTIVPMDHQLNTRLMKRLSDKLYGFLIYWLNSASKLTAIQTFAVTYMATFFGLSRMGLEQMGQFGYGLKERSFDKVRQWAREQSRIRIRYVLFIYYLIIYNIIIAYILHNVDNCLVIVNISCDVLL
jgi:hypothetical protein